MAESPVVRNVSDTALWAAYFRAEEGKRPDALFRDPYAERFEDGKGAEIARKIPQGQSHAWAWVMRTYLFDHPEKPRCALERVAVDLSKVSERRKVFASIATRGKRGVILTEGLLIYLAAEDVASFARDLADVPSFDRWIFDIHSPRLLKIMQKNTGKALDKAGAPFRSGPAEGPGFFGPHGWDTIQAQGLLRVAARFGRPPFFLRMLAKLPEGSAPPWKRRPWSGVCVMQKRATAKQGQVVGKL